MDLGILQSVDPLPETLDTMLADHIQVIVHDRVGDGQQVLRFGQLLQLQRVAQLQHQARFELAGPGLEVFYYFYHDACFRELVLCCVDVEARDHAL